MNHLALFLDVLCITGQAVMHIFFLCRLTGKKVKIGAFFIYLTLI